MGGIGETTLAQKIYNKLRAKFKPICVCVSQDFSETNLLRSVISRSEGNPADAKDKEDLELLLHEIVKNKKLFIVLDDVWDAQVWGEVIVQTLAGCFT